MDLLATYTHNSELQVITALSLISTFYCSLEHTQPGVLSRLRSPLALSWQRILALMILQLHALRLFPHSSLCRTQFSTDN
jgi:hypothetical protein